jgi:hypothetical protein
MPPRDIDELAPWPWPTWAIEGLPALMFMLPPTTGRMYHSTLHAFAGKVVRARVPGVALAADEQASLCVSVADALGGAGCVGPRAGGRRRADARRQRQRGAADSGADGSSGARAGGDDAHPPISGGACDRGTTRTPWAPPTRTGASWSSKTPGRSRPGQGRASDRDRIGGSCSSVCLHGPPLSAAVHSLHREALRSRGESRAVGVCLAGSKSDKGVASCPTTGSRCAYTRSHHRHEYRAG